MERETGFEPATPSLEGSCSSQLSYSRQFPELRFNRKPIIREYFSVLFMVERGGFEPPKPYGGRFTVCSLWPLGNLSFYPDTWFALNVLSDSPTNGITCNQFLV